MSTRTLRGKVAVAGIGETTYYKHGQSPDPEFKLALMAILRACEDAGIAPREIDGFASYSNDRNDPSRLAAALGLPELRFSNMQWGGGGGGGAAAVGNAAAAIATGLADCVVVFRALAQGQFARFGQGAPLTTVSGEQAFTFPYGLISPAQRFAMRVMRFMHDHGIGQEAQRAIALASYQHAQANPRAVMHGRPLTPEMYDASRWIVEPFRLFDCCLENDGAAVLVLVPAERARDLKHRPVYLLGVAQGSEHRNGAPVHNAPLYATSSFTTVAPHLYDMAGVAPKDVRVVQSYENFTGGVLMSLVEHGLFGADEANEVCVPETFLAPGGRLPLNTSGGNLAECYMHGLELQLEAVRQIRGESPNQVPDADVSMVCSGPMVTPVSSFDLRLGGDRMSHCLPEGLPRPVPEADGLSRPYWEGARRGELWVQRCRRCQGWQWGPEWICHACLSFDVGWEQVEGRGRIYSWERAWHPVHPALRDAGPYVVVLVELPHAGDIRMLGNLVGDPHQHVPIGADVEAVFEHHDGASPYTLVQWKRP